jgi:predicted Zn-dependent protease
MGEWDLAEQVLSHCRRRRLEAEVFIQRSRSTTIEGKYKHLLTFMRAYDLGIGWRVILGRKKGCA